MIHPNDSTIRGRGDAGGVAADMDDLKSRTRDAAERIKQSGAEQLESGKSLAAEQAQKLAGVVHRVGEESQREGDSTIASYATDLASGLERFADTLRSKSINDLANEAQSLARRNPALFIAGSIGVGFAIARFLKASSHSQEQPSTAFQDSTAEFRDGVVSGSDAQQDWTAERSEYFASDSESSPPSQTFASGDPSSRTVPWGDVSSVGTSTLDKKGTDHG